MLQNFGKYAPNLPIPLYYVPNNLQIYLGWRLDPPTYVGTNSQILPFFFFEGIPKVYHKNVATEEAAGESDIMTNKYESHDLS